MDGARKRHPLGAPRSVTNALHVKSSGLDRLFGGPALCASDDVGCVPVGPVVLRSARFVGTMVRFRLSQELRECRDVQGQSTSGKPRVDLLEQPAIAIGVLE